MVTEAGSYLRPIDSCITQLKAQGPSRTCNESKEEKSLGVNHAASRVEAREGDVGDVVLLRHRLRLLRLLSCKKGGVKCRESCGKGA